MSSTWIKVSTGLGTHPKVVRIASALKADRLRVVGGLHAVWCLFDAHSEDGRLDGYTPEVVDELIGWPGFTAAMVSVEWAEETPQGIVLPNFERHNGQSAKRRATDAERKRAVRKASALDADKLRTREEKRREEKKELKSLGAPKRPPTGSRLEDDWSPPADWVEWAKDERPDLDVILEADKFRDFWISKPGKDGRKANWKATWRNWIRNARGPVNFRGQSQPAGYQPLPGEV